MKIHEEQDWMAYTGLLPGQHELENRTIIWEPALIHRDADIGARCVIGAFTNICGPVKIGDRTRIQGFCFIPEGVEIGEGVFIGPNVTFTNCKWPRVRGAGENPSLVEKTVVESGASIGAGSVILPGVTIGEYAVIGAGSVVTDSVKASVVVYGNPAR